MASENGKTAAIATAAATILVTLGQFLQPIIDQYSGRKAEDLQVMQQEIDNRFRVVDSTLREGGEFIEFINTEMAGMRADRENWKKRPFTIGLKAKAGTDSLWYRDQDGHEYLAIYDPFVMWWKYVDTRDLNTPHKAAFFEIPWTDMEERQNKLLNAVFISEQSGH